MRNKHAYQVDALVYERVVIVKEREKGDVREILTFLRRFREGDAHKIISFNRKGTGFRVRGIR